MHDLELAAIVFALKIWRHYLFGVRCEIDPEETNGQSASRAAPASGTIGALTVEVLAQFAGLIAQMVKDDPYVACKIKI